ncbi:SsrA-binding protein [bacterium HR34]|nr:SsrA-binding protein [bacterium HR34]
MGIRVIQENKRAYHDYDILEKVEAGIILNGQEVKSVKAGRMSIKGSFVILKNNEFYLVGANIPPWQPKNITGEYNPERDRKLLLKKNEIKYLIGKFREKGLTFIPLKVYSKNGLIKLEFAIAKYKKKYSKKEKLKERSIKKEIERKLKSSSIWG